ncbi:MAG: DNA polymerase/3'-5' exonuclease PolX [Cyclobacteriaceae bacterium]|nr:DNA polymerase/3'-5' exonuclease PolX [Cyclobacteriaceae bacterium]
MRNKDIIKLLKLTALLLDLHDENAFKVRGYENAAFALERLDQPLVSMESETISQLDGIGKSMSQAIAEILQRGSFGLLDEMTAKTPRGILELASIKGIGPKKIRQIWKELEIDNPTDLLKACREGRLAFLKGFGAKTQETIASALEFAMAQKGKLRYSETEPVHDEVTQAIIQNCKPSRIETVGEYRRKLEIISRIDIMLPAGERKDIKSFLKGYTVLAYVPEESGLFSFVGIHVDSGVKFCFHFVNAESWYNQKVLLTGSEAHLQQYNLVEICQTENFASEEDIYAKAALPFYPPDLREGLFEERWNAEMDENLISEIDLKGILHAHSTYSDGQHSLREMALYCRDEGFEYLGISDHSRSAYYAKGLEAEKVALQQREIEALNKELFPFVIFKGIESDILSDGSLDYEEEVLKSFDFVIASIHGNLNMDVKKATSRLVRAIENPYTTMLGHPTGRLLAKREGYPIDHKMVIDACAANNVIIEINANPWRLDIDWRWIPYAMDKGVQISINPDAHEKIGIYDIHYGIYAARKGLLTKEYTFNIRDAAAVKEYFESRKKSIR